MKHRQMLVCAVAGGVTDLLTGAVTIGVVWVHIETDILGRGGRALEVFPH